MSTQPRTIIADGSSTEDAHPRITVNRDEDPWRYRCPNNHTRWTDEGSYILCHTCSSYVSISPVYRTLYDVQDDCEIPWSAVTIEEE